MFDSTLLVRFIALNYALFALTQVGIALTSDVENAFVKLFQWVFFALIALFAWFGA